MRQEILETAKKKFLCLIDFMHGIRWVQSKAFRKKKQLKIVGEQLKANTRYHDNFLGKEKFAGFN